VFPAGTSPLRHAAAAPLHVPVLALPQATPALQQVLPHGVVPAGHPHTPREAFVHAVPARQQHCPHGVVPALHGDDPTTAGPPHTTTADARNGFSIVAVTPATAAAPNALSTSRRLLEEAIASVNPSNRSLISPSVARRVFTAGRAYGQGAAR
jgi:hypothetical protein